MNLLRELDKHFATGARGFSIWRTSDGGYQVNASRPHNDNAFGVGIDSDLERAIEKCFYPMPKLPPAPLSKRRDEDLI